MGPQDGVDQVLLVVDELVHKRGRTERHGDAAGLRRLPRRPQGPVARALGSTTYVTFTGRVDRVAIAEHLSRADIGLCPDLKTPLNDSSTMNKTMEYMSYGLPAVSFDLAETRVSGGDSVAVRALGRHHGLRRRGREAHRRPGSARRARSQGVAQRVSAELDWRPQAEAYVAVFDDVTGFSQPGTRRARRRRRVPEIDAQGRRYVASRRRDGVRPLPRASGGRRDRHSRPPPPPPGAGCRSSAPDAPGPHVQGRHVSYAELWDGASAPARTGSPSSGVQRGDRVAIYLEKRIETVAAMFAASAAGGVFVPINHVLKPLQVGHILARQRGAGSLVTSADRLGQLADVLAASDGRIRSIVVGDAPGDRQGRRHRRCTAGRMPRPRSPRRPPRRSTSTLPRSSTPPAARASPRASCSATATSSSARRA